MNAKWNGTVGMKIPQIANALVLIGEVAFVISGYRNFTMVVRIGSCGETFSSLKLLFITFYNFH